MYRQQQWVERLANRRILIAGYGREGKSTHALVGQLAPTAEVTVAANDQEAIALMDAARAKGTQYDMVVKSPGIPTMKLEGHCDPETITSQTDLFLQIYGDQTIAVTGTKGKSTTTKLIAHVLGTALADGRKTILAGNIGIPLFDIVPELDDHSIVVAELSCHQLENIHRGPRTGVLLNLFPEHLDHYRDYRDYELAKMQLVLRQSKGDVCIVNTDSKDLHTLCHELEDRIHSTVHYYSGRQADQLLGAVPSPLQGSHNRANTYAAWLAAGLQGVTFDRFTKALASFQPLPHRLERVGTYGGITFYNDSISTIPQATIAAVETLERVDTLIVGGLDRGIDYGALVQYLAHPTRAGGQIRNVAFVGQAGRRIHDDLARLPERPLDRMNALLLSADYRVIVSWCFEHTATGKICLLSPAAASYDGFKNFEERGNTYKSLIQSMGGSAMDAISEK